MTKFAIQPTADGSETLFSAEYGQSYHSTFGALTESTHVFLTGTQAEGRLAAGQATRILEIGFGTGLNFFLTAARAQAGGAALNYTALEKALPPAERLAALNHGQLLPDIAGLRHDFLAWRAALPELLPPGEYRWRPSDGLQLDVIAGDAAQADIPGPGFHAIYLDAFSPDANPELWTLPFLARLFARLRPGGWLATYSVKGEVRRNLAAAGFAVHKRPGPPGKRHVLAAQRPWSGDPSLRTG